MRLLRSLAVCVLLCLLVPRAHGQTDRDVREALRARSTTFSPPATSDALEGALDAQQYRVGPGDVFSVSIGGPEPVLVSLPVSAEGLLIVPSAGSVAVSGQTLADAKQQIIDALRPYYRNVLLDVALAQPRRFLVHVSGAVPSPGRLVATPVARVDDVLRQAFLADSLTLATWIDPGFAPALRQVRIEHRDGTTSTVDVKLYRRTGDLGENPYLRDGDRLVVPSYDIATQSIYVDGGLAFPGAYEHRPDGTVADLLHLAGAFLDPAQPRFVRVANEAPIPLDEALVSTARVAPGTHVYVEEARTVGSATVEGYVRFPGTYRIEQGETTLRELVEMAGGLLPTALPRGAYLQRGGGRTSSSSAVLSTATLRTVQAPGDLPFVDRLALADQFYRQRLALELDGVLSGEGAALPLYDGDALFIPRDDRTVQVLGAVARPGYVPVLDGGAVGDYLRAAGGLRRAAEQVYVVRAGTQRMELAEGAATLASGDVILVTSEDPATSAELYGFSLQERNLTLQESNARRDARFRIVTTTLTVVSTAVGVLTTYLLIRDRSSSN